MILPVDQLSPAASSITSDSLRARATRGQGANARACVRGFAHDDVVGVGVAVRAPPVREGQEEVRVRDLQKTRRLVAVEA
jgi:hypothetical protein